MKILSIFNRMELYFCIDKPIRRIQDAPIFGVFFFLQKNMIEDDCKIVLVKSGARLFRTQELLVI